MGGGATYTMFQLDGSDAAAAYTMDQEMRDRGVPPHWMLYIATADADQAAAKAGQAGGKVLAEPFEVMNFGRMAVMQDPTGANFSVWEPKAHHGTGVKDVPGTLCWADLSTPDQDRAVKFYSEVFGWEIEAGTDGSGYLHIKNADQHIGGIPPAERHNPHAPPHWMLYFLVDNCDASAQKAKELGGHLLMEPTTMEKVGRIAIVADPQHAVFALFQPPSHN